MLLRLNFKINIARLRNLDFAFILALLSVTLFTRILLVLNAPFVYYFDSYAYVSRAVNFASHGTIQVGVGMPFIITLAALLYSFESSLGAVLVSRLLMLFMSAVAVVVIYLLGSRMFGKTFGFLAALLAIFEPYFLTYSIVPHSDVFLIAIGLTALYFATSKRRFGYVLAPVFFYLATFIRPEFFLVLLIPIVTISIAEVLKVWSKRAIGKFAFAIGLYVLPSIWVYSVYYKYTRFNPLERLILFLKPELLRFTLDSVFKFYDEALLNQIFFLCVAAGVGLALLTIAGQFVSLERRGKSFSINRKKDKGIREIFLSDKALVSLCVFLLFLIYVIVLTVYSIGYVIAGGTLQIIPWFPDRYLILPRLLLSYPLAYTLSLVLQSLHAQIGNKK